MKFKWKFLFILIQAMHLGQGTKVIAKPGNKTAAASWPEQFSNVTCNMTAILFRHHESVYMYIKTAWHLQVEKFPSAVAPEVVKLKKQGRSDPSAYVLWKEWNRQSTLEIGNIGNVILIEVSFIGFTGSYQKWQIVVQPVTKILSKLQHFGSVYFQYMCSCIA